MQKDARRSIYLNENGKTCS